MTVKYIEGGVRCPACQSRALIYRTLKHRDLTTIRYWRCNCGNRGKAVTLPDAGPKPLSDTKA